MAGHRPSPPTSTVAATSSNAASGASSSSAVSPPVSLNASPTTEPRSSSPPSPSGSATYRTRPNGGRPTGTVRCKSTAPHLPVTGHRTWSANGAVGTTDYGRLGASLLARFWHVRSMAASQRATVAGSWSGCRPRDNPFLQTGRVSLCETCAPSDPYGWTLGERGTDSARWSRPASCSGGARLLASGRGWRSRHRRSRGMGWHPTAARGNAGGAGEPSRRRAAGCRGSSRDLLHAQLRRPQRRTWQ